MVKDERRMDEKKANKLRDGSRKKMKEEMWEGRVGGVLKSVKTMLFVTLG